MSQEVVQDLVKIVQAQTVTALEIQDHRETRGKFREVRFFSLEVPALYYVADFYSKEGKYQYSLATAGRSTVVIQDVPMVIDQLSSFKLVADAIVRCSGWAPDWGIDPDFAQLSRNGYYRIGRRVR